MHVHIQLPSPNRDGEILILIKVPKAKREGKDCIPRTAGSSPRLAEVRRLSYIAHGTRTGGRSRVRTGRYCLYDVYTVRMHRDIAPVRVPTAPATLHGATDTHRTRHRYSTRSCTAIVLYEARSDTHAREALHALRAYPSPASQHVRRHACGDKSRIGSSAEPAWRMLGAQQLSSSISAARRLLSLPATRAHPAHSAQADWAGSTHLHTFHAHGHRPCRSFS